MKRIAVCMLLVAVLTASAACGASAPAATPNVQATVDSAIAATGTVQAGLQATIDAAVKATQVAVPMPTPLADYTAMTEEELAAAIDQAVAAAVASTQQCSDATAQAAADNDITTEEVQTTEVYVVDAEEAIAYAEELINAYYGLYGELATETLATLQAIEQDLNTMSQSVTAIDATLQGIDTVLQQGLTLAEDTIAQVQATAQVASAKAADAQAQVKVWTQNLPAELDQRAAALLAIQPDKAASDRQAAISMAFDYVDAVRQSLTDDKISKSELANIAQLGANAAAGLDAQGGPQLKRLSGSVNDITGQLARGQTPQAKAALGGFEGSLGARPPRPKP
jgi:hypothetical protein